MTTPLLDTMSAIARQLKQQGINGALHLDRESGKKIYAEVVGEFERFVPFDTYAHPHPSVWPPVVPDGTIHTSGLVVKWPLSDKLTLADVHWSMSDIYMLGIAVWFVGVLFGLGIGMVLR